MKYIQPTELELERLRYQHEQEKDNLIMLELISDFHINNPELHKQRSKCRKLKDKIILAEAYVMYPLLKKDYCMFPSHEYCEGSINYSFRDWVTYGNCCKICNSVVSKKAIPIDEIIYTRNRTAWDDLELLDKYEM